MIFRTSSRKKIKFYMSPLILLGALAILLTTLVILSIRNINREKRYMSEILLEKGATIIRSFESGARTGMMRMMWGRDHTQSLLEEIARQPGILYIYVTDTDGHILAANDRAKIGSRYVPESSIKTLAPGNLEKWRLVKQGSGREAFEVYRYFRPMHRWGGKWCGTGTKGNMCKEWQGGKILLEKNPYAGVLRAEPQLVFVGLDTSAFESGRKEDIRNTFMISSVMLLLGFAGFLTLFWAQNYKIADRLLQDTSAFAYEVVSHLPLGLVAVGREGQVEFLNGAAEKIVGVSLDDVRGKKPEAFFPALWTAVRDDLENGNTVVERELECEFPGGRRVPLAISATRILNKEGEFVGDVVLFRDLGEVRRLQEEVRRSEKLAALGGLAAGVAHEIRNPLSSIKGFATFFMGRFDENTEERKAAEIMIREVERLNRVISELLEFARPSELKVRETDIGEVLKHSLRLVEEDARSKGVVTEFVGTNHVPKALIDPDRFFQVLLNLYLNAIEAMEEGGRLRVGVSGTDDGKIEIEVTDTGKGIDRVDISRIFDPYFTTKSKGTGLGLAIVHKIVEAHGGEIRVTSTRGVGTTFFITIPAVGRGEHEAIRKG